MSHTAPGSSSEASTSAQLLSTLDAYAALTQALFHSIEQPGSALRPVTDLHASRQWAPRHTSDILPALQEVDALLAQRLSIAKQHSANQRRIRALKARAKASDRATRAAILQLDQMREELDDMVKLANEECAQIRIAEKNPLPYDVLLSYAQRLSRYTSAPPGYKLPTLSTSPPAPDDAPHGTQDPPPLSLQPDYNQYATRAAAYYDPAMPSMPQEMPFPSDALMRQGILNSALLLQGASAALDPTAQTGDAQQAQDDEMQQDEFDPAYSFHAQQQKAYEDEEDGFDLDLN